MRTASLLRDRAVGALLASEAISVAGTNMTFLALPWFVLTTTGSPARMAYVVAAELAPTALFGIASGAVLERLGSRRAMLVSDAARALLIALVPTLHLSGRLSFGTLLVLVFLVGVFTTPYAAAQRVIIPEVVGEEPGRIGEAMSLFQGATAVASLLGPALAGSLIAFFGATTVLYIDAATYLVAFVVLLVFVPAGERAPESEDTRGLLAGVRFLARDRLLRVWTLSGTGMNMVFSAIMITLPVLVLARFGERPQLYGWVVAAFGAGAVLGSVGAFRLARRVEQRLMGAVTVIGLVVPLWVLVADLPAWAMVASLFGAGLFLPGVNTASMTVRTVRTPPALRPKANAAAVTLATLLSPLGALAAGPAIEAASVELVLAVAVAANTALALTIAAAGLRDRARETPATPPAPAL